jgi:hypothetical protein
MNLWLTRIVWNSCPMNPRARETVPEYNLRRCCEDLEQARLERRFVRSLYQEAKRMDAKESARIIESWLPRSRGLINKLSTRKTRLRRKLESAGPLERSAQNTLT